MPTSNANNNNAGRPHGADNRSGSPATEAQDLKRILTLLADQVADADRRHSDALEHLQERLGQLGKTAEGLKEQLPNNMMPAIERIQGGMAALSDQIATTAAQRPAGAWEVAHPIPQVVDHPVAQPVAQTLPEPVAQPAPRLQLGDEPAMFAPPQQYAAVQNNWAASLQPVFQTPAAAPTQMLAPPAVEPAPALRSALAADALDAFARRAQANRNGAGSGVDHFDVVGSDTPHAEPSWDRVAAEALARHYGSPASLPAASESDIAQAAVAEQVVSAPTPENPNRSTPDAPVLGFESVAPSAYVPGLSPPVVASTELTTAEFAAEVASLQTKAMVGERLWLEDRFSDIAARLDTSLRDLDPSGPIGSIDARFTQLERKLTEVMAGTAKTTDLVSLENIESHVEDLTAQLVMVQSHFSRLDSIELELRSLAERLSLDNLANLLPQAPIPAAGSGLAESAAERMLQELPRLDEKLEQLSNRLSDDRIAAIMAQLMPSVATTTAIATLVAEQINDNVSRIGSSINDPAPQLMELRDMLESFVNEQRHGDEQTNVMLDTMQQAMIRLLDRMDAIEEIALSEPAEPEPEPVTSFRADLHADETPGREIQMRQHDESFAPAHAVLPPNQNAPQAAPLPHMQPALPPHRQMPQPAAVVHPAQAPGREDLVAAARRASRMAHEAANDQNAADENANLTQKLRRAAEVPASPAPEIVDQARPRRQMSKVSMALLCLVAVGASFAIVKSTILAPGNAPSANAPSASQQAAPKAPNQKGSLQNLDDADVIIEEERRGGAKRRSSLPSQSGGGAERDFATAFEGGPSSAVPAGQLQNYGGFSPAMSEFARQNIPAAGGAVPTQTALTKDRPAGALAAKSNDALPLSIGPNSLRAAALKGDPSAEFEIGARFAEGRGITQDLEQAMIWYQRSAAQAFGPAQYRLGSMYERGLGVKADMARARVWYQRAAEQGIVKAMHNLAVLTAGRDSAATDYEAAAKWFKSASEYGLTDSQFNLAIMYDSGLGVPSDPKLAYRYFTLAARSGDDEAARRRETLRAKLQPQETAEVDAELQKWRPRSADQAVNDPRMAGEGWKTRTPH